MTLILILILFVLTCLFGVAFKLTGAVLKACLYLLLLWPLGLMLWILGLVCCCTLILIPVGILLFKAGFHIMVPGI